MGMDRRRIVDGIDALTEVLREGVAEIRTANRLAALRLGASELEHDEGKRATTKPAIARVAMRNRLRADVRAALGLDETEEQG